MLVKNNIEGSIYKNLMKYMFQYSDVISVIRYTDQHKEENVRKINVILSSGFFSKWEILNNFSEELVQKIWDKFQNDEGFFDENYRNTYEVNRYGFEDDYFQVFIKKNRRRSIEGCIYRFIYDHITSVWLEKYKDNLIKSEKKFFESGLNVGQEYYTIYYLKLDSSLRKDILERESLYGGWCFPNSVEDISFFKNKCCWLYSVSHENLCEIYCDNEEEYNYLKSIGVEFFEDKFVPARKETLYYGKY